MFSRCSLQNSFGCPPPSPHNLPEPQVVFSLCLCPPRAQDHNELTSLVHPWASRVQQSLWGPQCWLRVLFLQGQGSPVTQWGQDPGVQMLTPTGCMAFTCLSTHVLCSGSCNLWQSSQGSQERYPSAHSLLHLLSKYNRAPAMDLGLENISKHGHGHTTPRTPDTLAPAVHCGWNVLSQLLPKRRCHLPQGGPWSPAIPLGWAGSILSSRTVTLNHHQRSTDIFRGERAWGWGTGCEFSLCHGGAVYSRGTKHHMLSVKLPGFKSQYRHF